MKALKFEAFSRSPFLAEEFCKPLIDVQGGSSRPSHAGPAAILVKMFHSVALHFVKSFKRYCLSPDSQSLNPGA